MRYLHFLLLGLVMWTGASRAEGINLSWDDCGSTGVSFKTFACDQNEGAPFVLVASFVPPSGVKDFTGVVGTLDIRSTNVFGVLPDWWQFSGALMTPFACRDTSGLLIDTAFGSACTNPYTAGPPRAVYRYDFGKLSENPPPAPDWGRLIAFVGYPPPPRVGPLADDQEYYAFRLLLTPYKTTDPDSCAGCSQPACLVLNSIQIADIPSNDPTITIPLDRIHVTWQVPLATCPLSTPALKKTWGSVKSLYR